jgi:flagellar biosynthesis chaperone FliJ
MFPTNNPGALSLVSTDKDSIVKELHATLKISENYIKEAEREVPKQEKRISKCKELIAQLDTEFKEKQQNEERFAKLEETQRTQGGKLDEILSLLKNKMLP